MPSISRLNFRMRAFLMLLKKVQHVFLCCYNVAATMFRLCVDLVTSPLLPDPSDTTINQPNEKTRRDLGLRLQWMFANKLIDPALRELAKMHSRGRKRRVAWSFKEFDQHIIGFEPGQSPCGQASHLK